MDAQQKSYKRNKRYSLIQVDYKLCCWCIHSLNSVEYKKKRNKKNPFRKKIHNSQLLTIKTKQADTLIL